RGNTMGRIVRKTRERLGLIKHGYLGKKKYIDYLEEEIQPHVIILESQHGRSLDGNMYYIAGELATNPVYQAYHIYLSATPEKVGEFQRKLNCWMGEHAAKRIHVVSTVSYTYYRIMATAKYLFNDNTFASFFVKREEQIYCNTWHGTPLKTLGKRIGADAYSIGNAQRNFICADYLLYPNRYTMEHMTEDYMIENLATGVALFADYPRNDAFGNGEREAEIRQELGLEDAKLYAYMPTWRGNLAHMKSEQQIQYIMELCEELERKLGDDEYFYVHLHPIVAASVDISQYRHIRLFPVDYETYEFLSVTDVLVTDYSSVLFDYAKTGRKMILYAYDEAVYRKERGFYLDLTDLPFPIVREPSELLRELHSGKQYEDAAFLTEFCPYAGETDTAQICRQVILGEETVTTELLPDNGKENVLIFAGDLANNGITTALLQLLEAVDVKKRNYIVCYTIEIVRPHKQILKRLPEGVAYLGYNLVRCRNLHDTIVCKAFTKNPKAEFHKVRPIYEKTLSYDRRRIIGDARINHAIQFSGYDIETILMFSTFDCNTVIYVHNDMEQEIVLKHLQKWDVLHEAYRSYRKVAVVTKDLIPSTSRIADGGAEIYVARNLIHHMRIRERSKEALRFDKQTKSNHSFEALCTMLDSGKKIFLNVGRFSPEKGQERLLYCFAQLHEERRKMGKEDIALVIIGGYGVLYDKLVEMVRQMEAADDIFLIKGMSNPFPLVAKCDYFVLSSFYEGFGLVLAEADVLGLPCISTEITGPATFMQEHHGTMVPNDEEGIYAGMQACLEGRVQAMHVDYDRYNREAVQEFENLLH
ncbi:MAG: CDP-glycerol glycerophosphotransferase family protein, partial [Lachnospiraceae bacterium]